jgi:hypothetical protein
VRGTSESQGVMTQITFTHVLGGLVHIDYGLLRLSMLTLIFGTLVIFFSFLGDRHGEVKFLTK